MSTFGHQELFGYKTLYREIGYYISHLEQYERSLRFFDEAIQKTPNDRRALMGRAWARSKACKYEEALDDIRKVLKLDPGDLVMLAHKALNTYLNCEFEDGLIQNTRLMPKRKKPDCFELGAMHCFDAIENCIGLRAGHPLRNHYKFIRGLAWKKNYEDQFQEKVTHKKPKRTIKKKKSFMSISKSKLTCKSRSMKILTDKDSNTSKPTEDAGSVADTIYTQKSEMNIFPPPHKFPYRPLQNLTTNIKNYMAEKYLDSLYKDKIFLKELSKKEGIECPNKVGTETILQIAKNGYKTVKYKQELLRARRPFYFIKYQSVVNVGENLRARQEAEFNSIREKTKKDALVIEAKIIKALADKQWRKVLVLAEKMKTYCNSKPKTLLPDREKLMLNVYEYVCQAHFDLKRLNPRQNIWSQNRRIMKMLEVPMSREPSKDSVVDQITGLVKDVKKETDKFLDRLKEASLPEELCWIYYQLCRNYTDLKRFDLSRVFCKRCITEAKRIDNNRWMINALFEMIRSDMVQKDKQDAKFICQQAIELSKIMEDNSLMLFFMRAREILDKVEFLVDEDTLEKRQHRLVSMIPGLGVGRPEAGDFQRRKSMAAAKRKSMMPVGGKDSDRGSEDRDAVEELVRQT